VNIDSRRLYLLALRDFRMNGRTLLVSGVAAVCAICLISLLNAAGGADPHFHRGLYGVFLFFGGFISSSLMFVETHRKETNHAWLMLPASNLEKFLTRLLYSSVGYFIASLAVYCPASALSEVLNAVIVGRGHPVFNPFVELEIAVALKYFVVQSVFLYGAILFRKNHFIKTVVCIVLVLILAGLFFAWYVNSRYGVFHGQFSLSLEFPSDAFQLRLNSEAQRDLTAFFETVKTIAVVLFWAVLAPACWVLTYVRIRKVQVSHGV